MRSGWGTVLSVRHGAELYPVWVENHTGRLARGEKRCNDESELDSEIGKILSSKEVHDVIKGLLSQVKAEKR